MYSTYVFQMPVERIAAASYLYSTRIVARSRRQRGVVLVMLSVASITKRPRESRPGMTLRYAASISLYDFFIGPGWCNEVSVGALTLMTSLAQTGLASSVSSRSILDHADSTFLHASWRWRILSRASSVNICSTFSHASRRIVRVITPSGHPSGTVPSTWKIHGAGSYLVSKRKPKDSKLGCWLRSTTQ